MREGAQVEIGGNDRYVAVSRKEFKDVFFGGKRIKFIEPPKVADSAEQMEMQMETSNEDTN